jgi:PAS domain S-box-containing protein
MRLDGNTLLRLNGGTLVYGGDTRKSQVYKEINKSAVGCYTAIAASDGVLRSVCYRVIEPYSIIILAGSTVASIENMLNAKTLRSMGAALVIGVLTVLLSGLLILGVLRQKRFLNSQKNFNDLIEMVPQSICRIDAHGDIVWTNRRTVEFSGPSPDEQAKGFGWVLGTVHPEDRSRLKGFIQSKTHLGQSAQTCEYRKRRFDGVYVWYSSQITQVMNPDGVGYFFLKTGTDIHDRKMTEERSLVTQKFESIGQLTGGMAHDFNNLLAIIIGNLDLLKPDVTLNDAAKRLDVAISAAQRGAALVKSLLAMASKQPLMPGTVDLWALVERISPLLRHALGPRINFDLKPSFNTVNVEVDEAGLEAVLLNLIVNARDAMPQGGTLSLSLTVSDGIASIFIKDSGRGMSDAVLKRATEPFFTTKEQGRGTGLGLSMVAGFAKQSGGKLTIQSVEGIGTTVEIAFPISQAPQPAARKLDTVSTPTRRSGNSGKLKILIVDDEPALSDLMRDWARSEGYTAVVAHSADDALEVLAVKSFDVMLTDIMMAGRLDGIGLAQETCTMHPQMKILLMSGYSKETATNRAEIPWQLLVKPFGKQDFIAALEKSFEGPGLMPLA